MQSSKDKKPKIITIASGKGGVGKSIIAANIANILSLYGYRVAIFDASLGLSNQDIILNVKVGKNILNVLKKECLFSDILIKINENFTLIPTESGDEIFDYSIQDILDTLADNQTFLKELDYLIFDTSSGIGKGVQHFINEADEVIIVTEPSPCAITDAYATIKIAANFTKNISLILNSVSSSHEGNLIYDKIKKVALTNLDNGLNISHLGSISQNSLITKSSKKRLLFSTKYPNNLSSYELNEIIKNLVYKLEHKVLYSKGRKSFTVFVRRLIEKF